MKKKDDWLRGFCCCIAIVMKLDGCALPGPAEVFYGGIGQATEKDLLNKGVEPEDIEVFKEYGLLK